jgi:hypothetical protein
MQSKDAQQVFDEARKAAGRPIEIQATRYEKAACNRLDAVGGRFTIPQIDVSLAQLEIVSLRAIAAKYAETHQEKRSASRLERWVFRC